MKSRRGLSTVVGAVFFVIAATTVITYISYSMNAIDEFAQSVIVSEAENINRGMEDISISQATIVGGEFNATVINTGSLPVQLTRLWIVDEDTGVNSKADLDIRINPGNQQYNIGQGTGISADSTTGYILKAVTSRGNIATFSISPDVSTQIQIILPAEVTPEEEFRVVSIITNNSTSPNNIANLVPTITNNSTLTQVEAITPSSVAVLPKGNSVTFTSSWIAPTEVGGVMFTANYTGAPLGAGITSNMTVALTGESEEATNSQWSQAASRVGILISGVPNPVEASSSGGLQKWGVGIINPLNRDVEVYAISVSTPGSDFLGGTLTGHEPNDLNWRLQTSGNNIVLWEGGSTPHTIEAESVGNFRATIQGSSIGSAPTELLGTIQALTSEGKLSTIYPISAKGTFPTINVFYTSDPSDPGNNWGYLVENVPSGKTTQIFNATIQNSSVDEHEAYVKLIILIPSDFTNVASYGANSGFDTADIAENPDGSNVIQVQTAVKPFEDINDPTTGGYLTYQFSADVPTVSDTKLYVLQTTSVYVDWTLSDALQTSSALSEAGVQVIVP